MTIARGIEILVAAVPEAGMGEEVDQRPRAGQRPLDPLRPDDRRRRRHHRVRGVAGLPRRVGGDQDRVADQVDLGRHRDVEHRPVVSVAISCTSGRAKFASSGSSARSSTEWPCTLVTWAVGSITEAPDLSFMFWRAIDRANLVA